MMWLLSVSGLDRYLSAACSYCFYHYILYILYIINLTDTFY